LSMIIFESGVFCLSEPNTTFLKFEIGGEQLKTSIWTD
jgi:hypothetical protein